MGLLYYVCSSESSSRAASSTVGTVCTDVPFQGWLSSRALSKAAYKEDRKKEPIVHVQRVTFEKIITNNNNNNNVHSSIAKRSSNRVSDSISRHPPASEYNSTAPSHALYTLCSTTPAVFLRTEPPEQPHASRNSVCLRRLCFWREGRLLCRPSLRLILIWFSL